MSKKLALLIPPIRRLYLDRNRLAADKEALYAAIADLDTKLDHERQEKLRLQQEIEKIARKRDELRTSSLRSLSLRQCDLEAMVQRSGASRVYAVIGSAGRTATHWIAEAFNLHDNVFFSHGPDLEPRKEVPEQERLDVFLRIARQMDDFDFSDIDKYFDLLALQGDFVAYGNIHGVIPTGVYQHPNEYRRSYYACAVVRHPIPRVQSFVNRWQYESRVSELRRRAYESERNSDGCRELLSKLSTRYMVDGLDEDAALFVKALDVTLSYDKHYLDLGLPVYLMERLVSDVDYFLGLFHAATGGRVEPHDQYLEALRRLVPLDRRSNSVPAGSIFSSWSPWKRQFFADEVARMELLDAYHLLGYDLGAVFSRVPS